MGLVYVIRVRNPHRGHAVEADAVTAACGSSLQDCAVVELCPPADIENTVEPKQMHQHRSLIIPAM